MMANEFVSTRWSLVLAAAEGEGASSAAALEQLCRDAWQPLYAFARRWRCSKEDAEDAVQGFISTMLARQSLQNVVPGHGRFRSYLLAGMRNHLLDTAERAATCKRGGNATHLPLDGSDTHLEDRYGALAAKAETPEQAFDRVWALSIMERAREKLAHECAASGKTAIFQALFPSAEEPRSASYEELGAQLGMSATALRTQALRLRRRWRDLIRMELSQTVASRESLEEEMDALRSALAG